MNNILTKQKSPSVKPMGFSLHASNQYICQFRDILTAGYTKFCAAFRCNATNDRNS